MNIAIIGFGNVGRAVGNLFAYPRYGRYMYDPYLQKEILPTAEDWERKRETINKNCAAAFVCVPTPALPGNALDMSIVEEAVGWLETPVIIIKSTLMPGTVDRLWRETGKPLVVSPEYLGAEAPAHPFADMRNVPWVVLGGRPEHRRLAWEVLKRVYDAYNIRPIYCTALEAECAKLIENATLALLVSWNNEIRQYCDAIDADPDMVREIWLADPRMPRTHSHVYDDDPGWNSVCLNKDVPALVESAGLAGYDMQLLKHVLMVNQWHRE